MRNNSYAIIFFLFSLLIFGLTFWCVQHVLDREAVEMLSYPASFICSVLSLVLAVKNIKRNKSKMALNIITIVGAGLVLTFYIFLLGVIILHYLSPFEVKP